MKITGQYVRFRVSFVAKDYGKDHVLIDSEHTKPYELLITIPIPDEYLEMVRQLGQTMKYDTDKRGYVVLPGTPGIRVEGEICQTVYLTDLPRMAGDEKAKKE